MSDEAPAHDANQATSHVAAPVKAQRPTLAQIPVPTLHSANSNSIYSPNFNDNFRPSYRTLTARPLDIDDYFRGPRNIVKHSKWPYFLRLQGSVTPKMITPLVLIAGWATLITCISQFITELAVSSTLLTVIGFVVALALSFRCSSSYERYIEGRKYWSQLLLTSWNLARVVWIHTKERHEDEEVGKADLLAKLTAINLINAYAVALKHRLRFEPAVDYPDLKHLVGHLDTFAGQTDQSALQKPPESKLRAAAEYMGISFAQENPRKLMKQTTHNLGNLPLEILTYLSAYMDGAIANETLKTPIHQATAMNNISALAEILVGMERVLNTPLPIAYSIAISQITHLYVAVLPFQLFASLGWVTIPATIFAAYIILGLVYIGYEVENPFGEDVNDLPLDDFCRELAADIDVLTSNPAPDPADFVQRMDNKVLYPLSVGGYALWRDKSTAEIRAALKAKATFTPAPSRMGTEKTSALQPAPPQRNGGVTFRKSSAEGSEEV